MDKVELKFMVAPEDLREMAHVPYPVRLKIVDAESPLLKGLLGDSGRKLAKAGAMFYFEFDLAERLIEEGVARAI